MNVHSSFICNSQVLETQMYFHGQTAEQFGTSTPWKTQQSEEQIVDTQLLGWISKELQVKKANRRQLYSV